MRAGDYCIRLEWLKRIPDAQPDSFGQRPRTHESAGYLWCAIDEATANRETEKESEGQKTSATVRIRNYPAIVAGDRLYDAAEDDTWEVKTARATDDNETVCEVERDDRSKDSSGPDPR